MVDLVLDPSQLVDDMGLAKRVGEALHKHYPGYLWGVHVRSDQGVLMVYNLRLSGQWGFVLKLRDVYQDPTLKCVMRAGGEILERYSLSRSKMDAEQVAHMPKDNAGLRLFERG
jgi:hypothetical protein